MSTPESETSIRLRRASEALARYHQAENDARRALADAVEQTRRAKEKHDQLFLENEHLEYRRRVNG